MAGSRCVEVAVDAAGGAGGRTYSYRVPAALESVAPGEAVIVEFGRRQALGIVLADAAAPADVALKPLLERVRSDGPLLPPLTLALARWMTAHYLAPAALVVRAMLPPGLLERSELWAWIVAGADLERLPDRAAEALRRAGERGLAARNLAAPPAGRAALLRALRAEAAAGRVELAWTIRPAGVRPRLVRWARLTEAGRAVAAEGGAADAPVAGRAEPAAKGSAGRLGVRQRAVIADLLADELAGSGGGAPPAVGLPAPGLAERHGGGALTSLARRGLIELSTTVVERRPLGARGARVAMARPPGAELSPDQQAAVEAITEAIAVRRGDAFLLEGATAAGKTAVYVTAARAALETGRGALFLVPEVALAAPLLDRLGTEMGEPVALLHGGLGEGERADEWRRIRRGEVRLVVGTRTAVLAPLADPGLIVVDEEHDPAYKADRTPRYQARDAAVELGRLAGAPVVLGSATPDVVTWAQARAGLLGHLRLHERIVGQAPALELVDLRAELAAGNRSLLSRSLRAALGGLDVAAGERAILVLNRRGSASIVVCRDCGYVQVCPDCQRPLVYHAAGRVLRCHHCGASAPLAQRCPACGSARIRYLGGGTERVEAEVRAQLPGLRVGRLDRDVAARKGALERVIDAFTDGALDVLVGTSLVTKGLDVPEVVLVGVVSADVALMLPDERAAERTYQLLRQAIGRAGRGVRAGRALIQTYLPDHPVLQAIATDDPGAFYASELAARRAFGSPPFGRLIKLTVSDEDREAAEQAAREMAERLRGRALALGQDTLVLGPAPAYVARRAGRWRYHLVLRGEDPAATLEGDPGPSWSVDVDPETLL